MVVCIVPRIPMRASICSVFAYLPLALSIRASSPPPRKPQPLGLPVALAFAKGAQRYVWSPSPGAAPERWLKGIRSFDEALAPNGSAMAFTWYGPQKGTRRSSRHIAVCEGAGQFPRILDSIPGDNSYGPVWSPDGNQLAFRHQAGKGWEVALVYRDGSGFRILDTGHGKALLTALDLIWSADGKGLWICTFEGMTQRDLEGRKLAEITWESLGVEIHQGSSMFALAADGRSLAILADEAPTRPEEWCDPTFVLLTVDLETRVVTPVRRKLKVAAGLTWIPGTSDLLLEAWGPGGRGVYRITPSPRKDWTWTRLIAGAQAPSLAARATVREGP